MISKKMSKMVAGSSLIRAMFEEGAKMIEQYGADNVYDFSLGNPNVAPPESIKTSIKEILDSEQPGAVHGYMNNSGYPEVREAIAEHTNRLYGTQVPPEGIIMTCGAAGGLNILFKTLLDPGDEVVVFAPYFTEYDKYADNYDAVLRVVPADTATFQPNLELLPGLITERTKAILVNSPNNPTGVIYSEETLKQLAAIIREKEAALGRPIYLVSDEPYRELVYDGAEVPYILNFHPNAIVGYSYSKSLSLPGERIGYLVVSPECDGYKDIVASLNVANRILGFVNAPSLFQKVAAANLDASVDVGIYKENRDLLYNHLTGLGFSCVKPEGAFYLFPKAPIEDDVRFCSDAKQFNLLLVPGSAFGCPGHFRISYCISKKRVENSLPAFEKLWQLYSSQA